MELKAGPGSVPPSLRPLPSPPDTLTAEAVPCASLTPAYSGDAVPGRRFPHTCPMPPSQQTQVGKTTAATASQPGPGGTELTDLPLTEKNMVDSLGEGGSFQESSHHIPCPSPHHPTPSSTWTQHRPESLCKRTLSPMEK